MFPGRDQYRRSGGNVIERDREKVPLLTADEEVDLGRRMAGRLMRMQEASAEGEL